ncbi:uncharacterized protein MKZ38_002848 [Zalerion maritima]|uniref:AMMECR1 domain-containing protein n=1 Tax=Zalerion maritima TaxID=339359 RepID=A0AAD5RZ48_9PEZI|nr:uncharacterized protein MKZ38_002848 [Zalerion maritima]
MATHAHCIVCFDALYSDLVKQSLPSWDSNKKGLKSEYDAAREAWRRPLSLVEVEKSWTLYKSQMITKKLPALERLAQNASVGASGSSDSSGTSTPSSGSSTSLLPRSGSTSASGGASAVDTPATSTTSLPDHEPVTESPLFVTWDTETRSGAKELRGCIGTFETLPLEEGLPSYARTSAFDDHRFDPVSFSELSSLVASVTLLTNFETAASWDDWEVGKHGIKIRVSHNGRSYSATYLPQVAEEQEWDHEQTLSSLMRKAGFRGDWKKVPFQTTRYQGKKVELEWKEYKAWRDWDDARRAQQKQQS